MQSDLLKCMQDYLTTQLRAALARLENLPDDFVAESIDPEFETPNNPEHGDLATSIALKLARPLRRAPRQIAEALRDQLELDAARVAAVEIAGPGFLNFRFADTFLTDAVA